MNGEQLASPIGGEAQEHLRLRTILGRCAIFGAVMAGGALSWAHYSPGEISVGPHQAEIALNLHGSNRFDLGPTGYIEKGSEFPLNLGATITLKGIPNDAPAGKSAINAEDQQEYAGLLDKKTLERTANDALWSMGKQGGKGALAGLALTAGLYGLMGQRRRRELREELARPVVKRRMAFGVGLASVVLASGSNVAQAYPATEKVNEVFDGTPLEGARIQGKLLQIAINRYGPQIIDFVRTSQSSYARSIEHFNNVFDEQIAGSLPVGSKVVLFETDKHFNFGMDSVFAAIAKKYNAHVLLSGGDETFSGSSFEEQGIANLSANLKDVQIVMAPGNHDSIETERQAKRHGITVLDGKVITVEGLRILGDNDPRRSVFGKEIEEMSQETIEELGLRLAGVACQAGGVDIVLAHEPRVADAVINSGCTSIAMSGHLHKHYEFPRRSASGQLNYNGASAGGAMNGQSTLGPLRDVAEVTAFIFDSATNQLTSFDVIRINPDTSATIDRYVPSAIGAPKKVE